MSTSPQIRQSAQKTLSYRPFAQADIAAAHALSQEVKWPHRIEDWRFVAQRGEGFVAVRDGIVVGTALYWKFGNDRASIGMVIVSAQLRGHGIGRALMARVLDQLGERIAFLHATQEGLPLYEKLGFVALPGTTDQYQGTTFHPPVVSLPPGERLRPLGANDQSRLIELASLASGLDRAALLPALLESAAGIALDFDGKMLGFALFRRFGRGYAIGPVVATDSEGSVRAKAMISHWLALHEGAFIRIDMNSLADLGPWLEGLGLARVDSVMRMVRNGPAHSVTGSEFKQIAIVNQALQ